MKPIKKEGMRVGNYAVAEVIKSNYQKEIVTITKWGKTEGYIQNSEDILRVLLIPLYPMVKVISKKKKKITEVLYRQHLNPIPETPHCKPAERLAPVPASRAEYRLFQANHVNSIPLDFHDIHVILF